MQKFLVGLVAAALVPAAAQAATDDFNRADAPTLGANWTQQAGTSSIVDNKATGSNLALATYNGSTGNSVSFDIFNNGTDTQYIAAVLGYGAGDNYFVKVQNNGGASGFNRYGFYTGNNNQVLFEALSSGFAQASVNVTYTGTTATLTINPLSGAQQIYSYNYGFTPTGSLNGLGFFGAARADNFVSTVANGGIPEPGTWALLILGFGAVGGAMRNRRRIRTGFAAAA